MSTSYEYLPRVHARYSYQQLALVVASGPYWYQVATPFNTSRNLDPLLHLEGPNGLIYVSPDNGNWWFAVEYMPRKLNVLDEYGFRLNRADPWVKRAGLTSVARMIEPRVPSVIWADPEDLPVDLSNPKTEYRNLSTSGAFTSGLTFVPSNGQPSGPQGSNFPYGASSFAFPHYAVQKLKPNWPLTDYDQIEPVEPVEPVEPPINDPGHAAWQEAHDQWVIDHAQWEIDHAEWVDLEEEWASWATWVNTPCYCIKKHGKITHVWSCYNTSINSVSVTIGCGLIPTYVSGKFAGWAAAQQLRCSFTTPTGPVTGGWLYDATGITKPLEQWDSDVHQQWEPLPSREVFSFNKDPQHQGPY